MVTFNEREVIVIDDDEPNNHPIRLQGEPQGSLLPSLNDPMSNLGNRESNLVANMFNDREVVVISDNESDDHPTRPQGEPEGEPQGSPLPPQTPLLHPWLQLPLDVVMRREGLVQAKEPRSLTSFYDGFVKGRPDIDYDRNFTLSYARVIYFFNPVLELENLRDIIPRIYDTAEFKASSKAIKNLTSAWQKRFHDFIYGGLLKLIEQEGGFAHWAAMTKGERNARFVCFYRFGPSQMAEAIYQFLQDYVDMKAIHLNQTDPRKRWADFIQANFLFACHENYEKRIRPFFPEPEIVGLVAGRTRMKEQDRAKKEAYEGFRRYPKTLHGSLSLSWEDIPVVATGGSGAHRKRKSVNMDDVVIPEGVEDYLGGDDLTWRLARRRRTDNGANTGS